MSGSIKSIIYTYTWFILTTERKTCVNSLCNLPTTYTFGIMICTLYTWNRVGKHISPINVIKCVCVYEYIERDELLRSVVLRTTTSSLLLNQWSMIKNDYWAVVCHPSLVHPAKRRGLTPNSLPWTLHRCNSAGQIPWLGIRLNMMKVTGVLTMSDIHTDTHSGKHNSRNLSIESSYIIKFADASSQRSRITTCHDSRVFVAPQWWSETFQFSCT